MSDDEYWGKLAARIARRRKAVLDALAPYDGPNPNYVYCSEYVMGRPGCPCPTPGLERDEDQRPCDCDCHLYET